MMGQLLRFYLFLSSYLPLFVILTVLHAQDLGVWALVFLVPGAGGLLGLAGVRYWVRSTAPVSFTIERPERKDAEALAYLFTYVFPFLDMDFRDPSRLAAFLILFGVVAVIYVASNMIHVNPVFSIVGRHIFEVETSSGQHRTVITNRKRLRGGEVVNVVSLVEGIDWMVAS